ncbi:MmpS family protein [Mycobacterium sp. SMC-4]|uniref:MmpS family protein n=1 Tax=Mycobacterium sp. SMC-4 TaxID=2857059 RepID=UPI0021B320E9|nr:MmpS family protein [Mycobacterium sp. SMC-4]UXA16511.1 MmpS family protein [Mycobacterium sp. SMC-4]
MTDSPSRGDQWRPPGRQDPTQAYGPDPGYPDPAYASQAPYGPAYQHQPTEQLPYPPYGYDPYATNQYSPQGYGSEPPDPGGPKSPRWLWVVAGVAVVTVVGLVIALVIVNSSRQETVMAPVPSPPEPTFTTPTRPAPTTTTAPRRPTSPVVPVPTVPTTPRTTPPPGPTDTVVYTVSGTGRAINISYVDSNGLLGTEFNVMLPWSKEVALPQPGADSASVSIINVGREVTCSITVDGTVVLERTGAGLTICSVGR